MEEFRTLWQLQWQPGQGTQLHIDGPYLTKAHMSAKPQLAEPTYSSALW